MRSATLHCGPVLRCVVWSQWSGRILRGPVLLAELWFAALWSGPDGRAGFAVVRSYIVWSGPTVDDAELG